MRMKIVRMELIELKWRLSRHDCDCAAYGTQPFGVSALHLISNGLTHTHTARSRDRGERATDSVPYAHERNGGCIGMYAVRASTRTQCCVIHINSVYVACNLLHNTSSCLASRSHIHYTFMNNIAHEHCPSCAAAEDSLLCCSDLAYYDYNTETFITDVTTHSIT